MSIGQVEKLTRPFDGASLECDGMTRVLHTVLSDNGIRHTVKAGTVVWNGKAFNPHFWIELPGGVIVDYRLRMWFDSRAPHGVFNLRSKKGLEYDGNTINMPLLTDFLFRVLAGRSRSAGDMSTKVKTFNQLRDEFPEHSHHLRMTCVECGNVQTCRCRAPKTNMEGICSECCEEKGIDPNTGESIMVTSSDVRSMISADLVYNNGQEKDSGPDPSHHWTLGSQKESKVAGATGDCYQVAGDFISDMTKSKGFVVVHGEVTGQKALEGIRYGHAWLEKGNMVYDYSNGQNIVIDKGFYYVIGNVSRVKKYTPKEAIMKMLKTGHYGPWN